MSSSSRSCAPTTTATSASCRSVHAARRRVVAQLRARLGMYFVSDRGRPSAAARIQRRTPETGRTKSFPGPRRQKDNRHAEGVENGVLVARVVGLGCSSLSVAWRPCSTPGRPATPRAPDSPRAAALSGSCCAARQFFRPSAFAELPTTAKPRTVGRVSGGQFDRSLRCSRVHAEY